MVNIRFTLDLLLRRVSSCDVLAQKITYDGISKEQFLQLAKAYSEEYTLDELGNIYEAVVDMIQTEYEKNFPAVRMKRQPLNVFGLLLLIVRRILRTDGNDVLCRYKYLIDWRQLAIRVSEDDFTTALCAVEDIRNGRIRTYFDWNTVISHDNYELRKILHQELSDNHFHLWASSPHFGLGWIRIMNDVDNVKIQGQFRQMDDAKLNVDYAYYQGFHEESFEVQFVQAALIRVYLFAWLSGKEISLREYTINLDENEDKKYKEFIRTELQNQPDILKQLEDECRKKEEECRKKEDKHRKKEECRKEIPVKNLRKYMSRTAFHTLWQMYTDDTVRRWLKMGSLILMKSPDIQLAANSLRRDGKIRIPEPVDYVLLDVTQRYRELQSLSELDRIHWELSGERYLLYHMYRRVFQAFGTHFWQADLFYSYLVLKEKLRGEIIQSNGKKGFRNFQRYDRRKGYMIDESYFSDKVLRMAIEDTLSNPYLKHLEVRIVPKNTALDNREYIRMIDQSRTRAIEAKSRIDEDAYSDRYYFVFHFVKEPDDTPENLWNYACRYENKRNQVMKQARAIAEMRERFPREARRVLGIDACSSESDCRPEVFAQAFRYLKAHTVSEEWKTREDSSMPSLRATYHVGEDFPDVVDGLRAVDEAIHFLNLSRGDRLGHALALGLDVKQYYQEKHNLIYLSKQDYLDNLVWMHHRIGTFHLESELNDLSYFIEKEFTRYFGEVYEDVAQNHNYNIRTYFEAWQLRGDNPRLYQGGKFAIRKDEKMFESYGMMDSYQGYAVNYHYPKDYTIRHIDSVAHLYHAYHFDPKVKQRGREKQEFHIPACWPHGVDTLQKAMQRFVDGKGISIECNPSSNCMISSLHSYAEHPIINWYNNHLETDQDKIMQCPQLSVSINTDDKGVFSTSIENEYSLMACALEMARDEDGHLKYKRSMVYEWLDAVREMGNQQSFWDTKR